MNNSIVVGKRIPIGAAVGGIIAFSGDMFNTIYPEYAIGPGALTGLSTALVALTQIIIVNRYGVTQPKN